MNVDKTVTEREMVVARLPSGVILGVFHSRYQAVKELTKYAETQYVTTVERTLCIEHADGTLEYVTLDGTDERTRFVNRKRSAIEILQELPDNDRSVLFQYLGAKVEASRKRAFVAGYRAGGDARELEHDACETAWRKIEAEIE